MIQLPKGEILDRAKCLRDKAQNAKEKLFKSLIGQTVSGIIEKSEDNVSFGKKII